MPDRPDLPLDRLAPDRALEVVTFDGGAVGGPRMREPHRHDYHELLWFRDGRGTHRVDGAQLPVVAGAVTIIGRGQVHQFEEGRGLHGAVVRFGEDLVPPSASWLLAARQERTIPVPAGAATDRLDALLATLRAEVVGPRDARSGALEAHLLATLLLWLERWYDGAHAERPEPDGPEVALHRRFAAALEEDFARHHDAAHYAQRLAVPAPALSRALAVVTGRGTKELVTDRVMLEARRLLRFTDRSVGEVAHAVGFDDPLYFSRAFKRHAGSAPQAWRDAARHAGMSMHP